MPKHITKSIAIIFSMLSMVAQAENHTSLANDQGKSEFLEFFSSSSSINFTPSPYFYKYASEKIELGYSSVHPEILGHDNRRKDSEMKTLSTYISAKFKVNHDKATEIIQESFTESLKRNLDPLLILSIIGIESTYKSHAKSNKGAIGLTQVIPKYHRKKITALKKDNLDLWSVKGNIRVATQILKEYIEISKGNIQKALQMYNGSTKDKTNRYSKKVLNKMNRLKNVSSTEIR